MKIKFESNGWFKSSEEDIFDQGCIPNTRADFHGSDRFTANTTQELIEQCMDFAGTDDEKDCEMDACGEIGRLDIQILENEDGHKASMGQIEDWKKPGGNKLYLCTYTFVIEIVTRERVSLTKPFVTQ